MTTELWPRNPTGCGAFDFPVACTVMKMNDQFEYVAAEIENLDEEIREKGLPDDLREVWQVETNVGTWCVPRTTAEFLYQLVLIKRPKTILELGTSIGYSTIWLAAAAKEVGGEVATIEMEPYKVESAEAFIARAGVADAVRLINGKIGDVLETWDEPVEFVFMDANKRGYFEYIKQLEPLLPSGSVIVADNVLDMGDKMQDYLDYVKTSEKYSSTLLEIDHGLMISVKK